MPLRFFVIECLSGKHVWREPEDSELGKRAKARIESGFIDALRVPCAQCDDCENERARRDREYADVDYDAYDDWN
jgi:hypothetical protein